MEYLIYFNDMLGVNSDYFVRILMAAFCGLYLGTERAISGKSASFRTFALVSAASSIFTILSIAMAEFAWKFNAVGDPTRIAAQVVSGVGFIGAGIIWKGEDGVEGITTAGMIWFASALGMLCGFGYFLLALLSTLAYSGILVIGKLLHKLTDYLQRKK